MIACRRGAFICWGSYVGFGTVQGGLPPVLRQQAHDIGAVGWIYAFHLPFGPTFVWAHSIDRVRRGLSAISSKPPRRDQGLEKSSSVEKNGAILCGNCTNIAASVTCIMTGPKKSKTILPSASYAFVPLFPQPAGAVSPLNGR